MDTFGTVALLVLVVLVAVAVAYAAATRASLVRMRDLAVEAGALAEQRRARLVDLNARGDGDQQVRRAVADTEHRLAGDVAFHGAAVRAYDERLSRVPACWVGALTGLHPLGAAAERQG